MTEEQVRIIAQIVATEKMIEHYEHHIAQSRRSMYFNIAFVVISIFVLIALLLLKMTQ